MTIKGSNGNDVLKGTAHNDIFDLSQGGNDVANGLGGDDIFKFGAAFTAADHIQGGAGNDVLSLDGNYAGTRGVTFGTATMTGVETIRLAAGHDYKLTTNDANVAAQATLKVDGGNLGAADILAFNGSHETDGRLNLIGGLANDVLTGGTKNDIFSLGFGGNDTANGGGGNDLFKLLAGFNALDRITGGTGTDPLALQGNYWGSHAVTFSASTMSAVEKISLAAGFRYDLATANANVALNAALTVDAHGLGASDRLTFDGRAETNGHFVITGGAGTDIFNIGSPDVFAASTINGGGGHDTIVLDGDFLGGTAVNITHAMTNNVETLQLVDGNTYWLNFDVGVVSSGTFTVDGSHLTGSNYLSIDAGTASGGKLVELGGSGNDTLTGGFASANRLSGGAGQDELREGGGPTTFVFTAASDSSSNLYDTVTGFTASQDHFNMPVAVTSLGAPVAGGSLNSASFDADIASAVGAIAAGEAIVFTPSSGDEHGANISFLIVNIDGVAGYQGGSDLVIRLDTADLTGFGTDNFI